MNTNSTATPRLRSETRAGLALVALGVVFGDIGTSPLYAFRECLAEGGTGTASTGAVLGILSLMVWTLLLLVTGKYAWLILKADNDGEGGILALSALVGRAVGARDSTSRASRLLLLLGMFGSTLFLADGMITPAISVLGAVEGIEVVAPGLGFLVIPLTLILLSGLFAMQRLGTARVGALFGPVLLAWFVTIGVLGALEVWAHPGVLACLNPWYGLEFLRSHGGESLLVLGAVFLVATGAEALYADLGHFGPVPIRVAWVGVVLPSLLLNYFGQGALVLRDPETAGNPFFHLAPGWLGVPLLVLATLTTVTASQAIITGAFSLARQAVMLGLTPRLEIRHTSERQVGQVYVPVINWILLGGTITLVIGFGSSARVAHAYGLAVALTMFLTVVLLAVHLRKVAKWPQWKCWVMMTPLFLMHAVFVLANGTKLGSGGWLPLVVGGFGFLVMSTWQRGQELLRKHTDDVGLSEEDFLASLKRRQPARVRGTAIFVTRLPTGIPRSLLHLLKHTKSLHERVVLLTVAVSRQPRVEESRHLVARRIAEGFYRVTVTYGFMEQPDVPAALTEARKRGELPELPDATYFLGRLTLLRGARARLRWFPRGLFLFLFHNASQATSYLGIPAGRSVEIGEMAEI